MTGLFRLPKVKLLIALAPLLVAGCDSSDTPPASSSAGDSVDNGYKTTGTFACRAGHAGQAVQISSSADVPPGGTATVTLQTPPKIPDWLTPNHMWLYCQVDDQSCVGSSCGGAPPVDFAGPHGDGLTWESLRSETGETKTVFKAVAHNSDPAAAHHFTLTLEMPEH